MRKRSGSGRRGQQNQAVGAHFTGETAVLPEVAFNCRHRFTGSPPRQREEKGTVSGVCLFCRELLRSTAADLWVCEGCGQPCHKRCVPTPVRVAVLRRLHEEEGGHAGPAVVLRDKR
eukprot:Hpha_TRINITY_DN32803_c0_g1::TRINITY_DN32803_c0_g1_i1::g.87254::m.87254